MKGAPPDGVKKQTQFGQFFVIPPSLLTHVCHAEFAENALLERLASFKKIRRFPPVIF